MSGTARAFGVFLAPLLGYHFYLKRLLLYWLAPGVLCLQFLDHLFVMLVLAAYHPTISKAPNKASYVFVSLCWRPIDVEPLYSYYLLQLQND